MWSSSPVRGSVEDCHTTAAEWADHINSGQPPDLKAPPDQQTPNQRFWTHSSNCQGVLVWCPPVCPAVLFCSLSVPACVDHQRPSMTKHFCGLLTLQPKDVSLKYIQTDVLSIFIHIMFWTAESQLLLHLTSRTTDWLHALNRYEWEVAAGGPLLSLLWISHEL